jgi:mono/diheme cytochrome c family protein
MRLLAAIGVLAILAALAGAALAFGGYVSVAARGEDPAWLQWALVKARTASIERHATDGPPAGWNEAGKVHEGARSFVTRGCVQCHGAPGMEWSKFSEGLNPGPPDLKEVAGGLSPSAIFWVVKNGIRMTGMPSFGEAGVPDDEIWRIAAFVKAFPTVSEADMKTWAAGPTDTAPNAQANP